MSGQAHDFGEMKSTQDEIFTCRNCGKKAHISDVLKNPGKMFECSGSKPDMAKPLPKRVKMKVANAFSSGDHKILWLAGGMAVYQKPGSEELFSTLDEAMKNCAVNLHLTQDATLIEQWKGGYELPADEYHDWPSAFLADNEGG